MTGGVDRAALDRALARLNAGMTSGCTGGVELEDISDDGTVRLRLLGMCSGCSCRTLTIGTTIRPEIESVSGVTRLDVPNSGMSRYAEERIAQAFAGKRGMCRA